VTPENDRFKVGIVMVTLAACAFFLAQGATAIVGAKMLDGDVGSDRPATRRRVPVASVRERHDPAVILRRNIFASELGDLTQITMDSPSPIDGEIALEEGEAVDPCQTRLVLRGTAVVPGDFDRSVAVILGSDRKTALYQGAAEVEGSRIRAIHSDSVFLQATSGALCKLAMFAPEEASGRPKLPVPKSQPAAKKKKKRKRPRADRNAGLSDEEIEQGIDKVSDTSFNVRRTLLNKVLDNAGRLIGIAAVSPKIENGKSIGMQIRGVRPGTLLEKLGIKNGDVLESVNGQSLTSTDAALGAYTTLRTADKFTLSVLRGGDSLQISYNLN